MGFVLIVMFAGYPSKLDLVPFVAMHRFESEQACVVAEEFVMRQHPGSKTKCIKDGKDDGTKPQQ